MTNRFGANTENPCRVICLVLLIGLSTLALTCCSRLGLSVTPSPEAETECLSSSATPNPEIELLPDREWTYPTDLEQSEESKRIIQRLIGDGSLINLQPMMLVPLPDGGEYVPRDIWVAIYETADGGREITTDTSTSYNSRLGSLGLTGGTGMENAAINAFECATEDGVTPLFWSTHWSVHTWLACKDDSGSLWLYPVFPDDIKMAGCRVSEAEYIRGIARYQDTIKDEDELIYDGDGWISEEKYVDFFK